jgi:hypothetical protein
MPELVEREPALKGLRERLLAAAVRGHVALVAGEAGIGKTSVLRALAESHAPVWWGACDALQTPLPLAAKAEIDGLLSRLESSGCAFSRNGNWYFAVEAKAHLLRKLAYLEDKGLVQTAKQFIERAASGSSTSGEPYLVKCGNDAPVNSGAWLASQLRAMRAAASSSDRR